MTNTALTLESPFREALERLRRLEDKLHAMQIHADHSTHFGLLFFGQPDDIKLKDLPKTRAVGHDIDHGEVMLRIIADEEVQLEAAIKAHPILAKRAGLK